MVRRAEEGCVLCCRKIESAVDHGPDYGAATCFVDAKGAGCAGVGGGVGGYGVGDGGVVGVGVA